MKRVKRPIRRPDPVEDSSDNSDSDEELVQCSTRAQGRKAAKTSKPADNSDISETAALSTKKAKLKRKKPKTPRESTLHSDSERPTQNLKDGKGKNKKPVKVTEPMEESSNNSDAEESPAQAIKKGKAKEKKSKIIKEEPTSDSDEQEIQILKNVRGKVKKTSKVLEPKQEPSNDSDSGDKPTQPLKASKGKAKKPSKVPEPTGESSIDSGSDVKPTQISKIGKGKVMKSENKAPKIKQEPINNSDSEEPTHVVKTEKKKAKKPYEVPESERYYYRPYGEPAAETILLNWCKGHGLKYIEEKTTTEQQNIKGESNKSSDNSSEERKAIQEPNSERIKEKETDIDDDVKAAKDAATDAENHLWDLNHLRRVDPDFHSFLMKNDRELLNFDADECALDDVEKDEADDELVHVPGDLHGDSDESDFEAEDAVQVKGKVTLKMVKELEDELRKEGRMKVTTLNHVIKLFHAAVVRATSADGSSEEGEFKVAGSSVFNGVLQMCVLYLPNAIKRYLGVDDSKEPQKCKHFVKIKGTLIQYLTDVLNLISAVTSEHILSTMLKHLHQMSKYVACFMRVTKQALRKLITLWSAGEETVRVLAFLCILRITRTQDNELLANVLKAMYMTYIKNCKFVSPTTWPAINFMRRSLVEMFSLNLSVSYRLAFLYIRQLGIHLRNAIVVKRLENIQAVYNWQYINSVHLWAELLQNITKHKEMGTLFYPLTMIISYTIKLVPTAQFFPVRFLLTDLLVKMSVAAQTYIPTLGFLLDVFRDIDYKKKHKTVSMKPLDFSCIIRLSKSQLNETGFNDAVIDKLYTLLLEYTASIAHWIAFPDINFIVTVHLKNLVTKCTVPNHTKKMKQLLDKIEESCKFMYKARAEMPCSMIDIDGILAFQISLKTGPVKPPLLIFYENWVKINKIQKRKNVTKNDELAGEIPMIKRPKLDEKELVKIDSDSQMNLFPSDSEDDNMDFFANEDEEKRTPKEKKIKKEKKDKKPAKKIEDDTDVTAADTGDIVQELSVNDW